MTRARSLRLAFPGPARSAHSNRASADMHSTSQVKGTVLRPQQLDRDLNALWHSFCSASPLYGSPFYFPEFTEAIDAARDDARVAVLTDRNKVIGFFPFHLLRSKIGKPIGGHINDYHGPILAPGYTVGGRELLQACDLHAYDYNHLPQAMGALAQNSHSSSISPQMNLEDGYEVYLERMGSRMTKALREMRRRERKIESELGELRFEFHDTSDAAYQRHIELKTRQYERMGLRTALGSGWIGIALDRLRARSERHFAGVLSTLHAGEELVAAHFGIRSANVLHWWFPSYDLELARFGPGKSLRQFLCFCIWRKSDRHDRFRER